MSSKQKGQRSVKKVIEYLHSEGYITDEVELGGRFRKHKDLYAGYCVYCFKREEECCDKHRPFEGFDLLAIHAKTSKVLLVQVKTNQPASQKNYRLFSSKFANEHLSVLVITNYDYDGLRIQDYKADGSIKVTDLRKSKNKKDA